MLKKIVVTALISGFAIASFAQASATASTPLKSSVPVAAEQKEDAPHCEKHGKHHHCDKKHEAHCDKMHEANCDKMHEAESVSKQTTNAESAAPAKK